MDEALKDKTVNVCPECQNIYKTEWLKVGDAWNDFGFRYCPFCGRQTEDFAHVC
jgi:hypothetical protein